MTLLCILALLLQRIVFPYILGIVKDSTSNISVAITSVSVDCSSPQYNNTFMYPCLFIAREREICDTCVQCTTIKICTIYYIIIHSVKIGIWYHINKYKNTIYVYPSENDSDENWEQFQITCILSILLSEFLLTN